MRAHRLFLLLALLVVACSHPKHPAGPPAPSGPVTQGALEAYVQGAFPDAVAAGTIKIDWGSGGTSAQVVEELALLAIDDMGEVAALVPADFGTKGVAAIRGDGDGTTNVAGLLRDLMIIHDVRGYFEKAWRNNWAATGPEEFPLPVAYGVDFSTVQDLVVFGEDGEHGDGDYDGDDDDGGDDDM